MRDQCHLLGCSTVKNALDRDWNSFVGSHHMRVSNDVAESFIDIHQKSRSGLLSFPRFHLDKNSVRFDLINNLLQTQGIGRCRYLGDGGCLLRDRFHYRGDRCRRFNRLGHGLYRVVAQTFRSIGFRNRPWHIHYFRWRLPNPRLLTRCFG